MTEPSSPYSPPPTPPPAPHLDAGSRDPKTTLGFIALIVAQFFGAMNDNVLKGVLIFMVIDGTWAGRLGEGGQGIVGVVFTLPFLFLSGYAGWLADRRSKSAVTRWVKAIELPIVVFAGIGFYVGSLWLTLAALVGLTCQSAFFGPAKYGMIPELVGDGKLSKANGTINMMTNLAVILGTLLAGNIADAYAPLEPDVAAVPIAPAVALVAVAIGGIIASLFLPRLPAMNPTAELDWNPLGNYIRTIREMAATRMLLIMMAWGYFYLLAGIALFILPEYTEVLKIDRTDASVLMGVLGISVGAGCAIAGAVSGDAIRPRLVPVGAAGLVIFFGLLGWVRPRLGWGDGTIAVATSNVAWLIVGAGLSAGLYIVPLQSLLQKLSPDSARGRYLGTANGVSFAFLTLAAGLYAGLRSSFGDQPNRMFLLCSVLMALGAGVLLWLLSRRGGMPATA